MKKRFLVVILATVGTAALWLSGYFLLSGTKTVRDPFPVYNSAAESTAFDRDITLTIYETKETFVNDETYILESQKTVAYDIAGDKISGINSHEKLRSGDHEVTIDEIWLNDQLYTTVNSTPFISDKTQAAQLAGSLPPVIIDAQLYQNITGIRSKNGYTISFSDPKGLERWLFDDTPEAHTAEGQAFIDLNGVLTGASYTATYTLDGVRYRSTVQMDISREDVMVEAPENTESYTKIGDPEALRSLEIACGYLLQTSNISADYKDNIYFQSMGDRRSQTIKAQAVTDDAWSAEMETTISFENDSRTEQSAEYTKKESFIDGQYQLSTNGGEPIADPAITGDEMRKYFQNQLISTLMLPEYIAGTKTVKNDDNLAFTFDGNDAFATFLVKNASQALYQNPDLLEQTKKNATATDFKCYLTVDKHTGLPQNSGIIFTGSYTVLGLIEYHAEQTYTYIR